MARRARMRRREFLKTTGLAAGVAATGLESIVAARRAPAHAQGTRLHILRWVDFINVTSKVDGKWLAVPHGIVGNAIAYRRSWHTEIGVKEFPQTWDEWREVGRKLKAKGKPVGQALGHSAGDPPTFGYPLLWSF